MDTQVIVVGAGPVGLMLAGELRLGGAEVTVLERLPAPATESRASTLQARTMEVLDQRGLLDRLGEPVPNRAMGHFGGLPLDFGQLPSRFAGQWTLAQTRLEELLAGWAVELGAELRRGAEVSGLTADADGVLVEADGPAGPLRLRAEYVVGCDGEQSTVRRLAGITMSGSEASRELLRADVLGVRIRDRRFERLPTGLAIAGRLPSGATRVMVGEYARPEPRTEPVTFAEVCRTWRLVTGEDLSEGTPLWVNAFSNVSKLADRYRSGRVLIAGDAAHLQLPAGGQAINLGLQDAVNLGWKLAAAVRGRAPAGLLDSYDRERREVGQRVLHNVALQSMLLLGEDADTLRAVLTELISRPVVRDVLAGMVSGLDVRYDTGGHPLLGRRLPHLDLDTGTSTTALLRGGRGLLLELSGEPGRRDRLSGPAACCAVGVDLVSAGPAAAGPLAGVDTVLVRPDGYIPWLSTDRGDPLAVLEKWFGVRVPAPAG
jgi:2-polyprenyl-6-methoxyphenol hydroxylase-like FAD-dependent oxidoreductase